MSAVSASLWGWGWGDLGYNGASKVTAGRPAGGIAIGRARVWAGGRAGGQAGRSF